MTWDRLRQQLPKRYSPQDVELVQRAYELAETRACRPEAQVGRALYHPSAGGRRHPGRAAPGRPDRSPLPCCTTWPKIPPSNIPDLAEEFGAEVASLVDGVTKLVEISQLANLPADSRDPKIESLRKMFLAMVSDVRVVLIKLADRLHNMRTMGYMSPGEAAPHLARDAGHLRAAGQPAGHLADQVGAGRPGLPLPGPDDLRTRSKRR